MAALDFPASPTLNQTYTANGLTWKWDGVSWVTQNAGLTGTVQVSEGGTSATDSAGARANLGLEIGTDVQGWSADLDAIDALAGTSGFLKKTAADTWSLDTNSYLTGNQSITISGDASGTGTTAISLTLATVPVTKGGTGQTTQTAAFDALSPTTTLGDIIYDNGTNAVRLAGNTTAAKQFLSQTGTGTVSAAPAWSAVSKTDVGLGSVENTALSTWAGSANITTLGTIATGTWSGTDIAVTAGGTGASDAATARTNLGLAIGTNVQAYDADLDAIAALAGTSGLLKKTAANTWTLDTTAYTANTGTVTSVGGTGTVSGLTLSGTVTTSGNLTLGGTLAVTASNFASQTANTFLSAPNGSAGVPTFRAIAAADIPTLNQNTTGSAATLTTARTLTIGSTGKTFNGSANVSWTLTEIGAPSTTGTGASGSWGISVTGSSASCTGNAATATTATNLSGGTISATTASFSGLITSKSNTATFVDANDTTLSIRGDGTYAATMSFHRVGTYAVNFGLDTDNFLKVGGWSMGAVKYKIVYETGSWGISVTGSSASCTGNAATATLATKASTLAMGGGNGTAATFNWSGQSGQPTWLWGSNDGSNHYVWNPSNFSVSYATSSGAATVRVFCRFSNSTIYQSSGMTSITAGGSIVTMNFSVTLADQYYAAHFTINTGTNTTYYAPLCGAQATTSCTCYIYNIVPAGSFTAIR